MEPLVVTALLADETQELFDELRRKHFPAERNHLDAHVTLFHALPGDRQAELCAMVERLTERNRLAATVAKVINLGRGVAYRLTSPDLMGMRDSIIEQLDADLTRQDMHKRELHVTIQNKVDPEVARRLCSQLTSDFEPFDTEVCGLAIWRYMNGPWESVAEYHFTDGHEVACS